MAVSNSTAYYEVAHDLFNYTDADLTSPALTSDWEVMGGGNTIESTATGDFARPLNNSSDALVRWKEEKPLPNSSVTDYNKERYRRYRAVVSLPLDYIPTATALCIQFEDANNYIRMRIDVSADQVILERVLAGVVSTTLGGSSVSAATFTQWTDPTVIAFEYWPTDVSGGTVNDAFVRAYVNGRMITFNVGGNTEEVSLGAAVRNWSRKSGLLLPVNARAKMFKIESRFGGVNQPSAFPVGESPYRINVPVLGRKFIPTTSHGFPAHDSTKTHAETQWELDLYQSPGWTAQTPPSNVTTKDLRFVVLENLTPGEDYRTRYRYRDNAGNWGNWSDYLEFTATGTAPLIAKTDSLRTIPLFPLTDVTFEEQKTWGNSVIDLQTGKQHASTSRDSAVRVWGIGLRWRSEEIMDELWDFYEARSGSAESFLLVPPLTNVAYAARFMDDNLSKRNFAANLFSGTLKVKQVL